jgi:hypothetical protein
MLTNFDTITARRILPSTAITPHQFLFSWNDKPCFARGELVALTGKAKSGKTYVCSILMALAVKRQLMGLQRLQDEPLKVLWIDTEQSPDSTQEILCIRIATLIEQEIPENQYFVYNLRQDNWQDRLSLVLTGIGMHKPDLVIFDGIRDVVGDINNYQEAQNVLGKLLSIASWSNACIVCVLHQNKSLEDRTLRGALGTELQNKSFETYECQKDPDTRIFTMRQTATRKYDIIQKLEFTVDGNGLPVLEQETRSYEQRDNTEEIVQSVARGEDLMRSAIFANIVKSKYPEMRNNYRYNGFLFEAFNKGLIKKETLPSGEVFYRFIYQQQELF